MKALVLGGGGARGAAHIGVLQALCENGYEFDIITGTSAGSLVGGFYAAGFTPAEITKISREINWEIFNIRWFSLLANIFKSVLFIKHEPYITTDSLISTRKFEKILKKYLRNTDFTNLKYEFATPAVDLHTGEIVTFCEEGALSRETPLLTDKKLWQAMRSSMALPVAFSPMEFVPWLLTDGGVKENLPVDLAAELGASEVLAVDVSPPMPPLKHDNFMHIGLRALDIIGQESNDWTARIKVDVIKPNVSNINTLDFNKLDEAIEAGYKAGIAYLKLNDLNRKG